MGKGTIYFENHNRGGNRQTRFRIWCAEIVINGKRLRKRSMSYCTCRKWLEEHNGTTKP